MATAQPSVKAESSSAPDTYPLEFHIKNMLVAGYGVENTSRMLKVDRASVQFFSDSLHREQHRAISLLTTTMAELNDRLGRQAAIVEQHPAIARLDPIIAELHEQLRRQTEVIEQQKAELARVSERPLCETHGAGHSPPVPCWDAIGNIPGRYAISSPTMKLLENPLPMGEPTAYTAEMLTVTWATMRPERDSNLITLRVVFPDGPTNRIDWYALSQWAAEQYRHEASHAETKAEKCFCCGVLSATDDFCGWVSGIWPHPKFPRIYGMVFLRYPVCSTHSACAEIVRRHHTPETHKFRQNRSPWEDVTINGRMERSS